MRGGYFRFQAQYLRRIRVPHWKSIPRASTHQAHPRGGLARTRAACDAAAAELYRLTPEERYVLATLAETRDGA